ncbi:adenosine deaminase [soil metagenome]
MWGAQRVRLFRKMPDSLAPPPTSRLPHPGPTHPGPPARDLRRLPKAHLHLHLVGGMRPGTLRELAARQGVALPPPLDGSRPGRAGPRAVGGWERFDALYVTAKRLLRRPGDLVRLVHEIAEDEAAAGSGWVEVTTNPGLYHGRFGSEEAVLELLLATGRDAALRTGVGIGWIVSADRRHAAHSPGLARLAARYAGQGVVGFGLANDERVGVIGDFAEAFSIARDAGLLAVPHAGEHVGAEAVADAVGLLRADRVGHGVRAVEDPAVLRLVAGRQVCLEVCPTSNVALGVTPTLARHPLPRLLAAGCAVTLGADDPLLFGDGLVAQYALARDRFGVDDAGLADIARTGVAASAAPPSLRRRLLDDVNLWLAGPSTAAA